MNTIQTAQPIYKKGKKVGYIGLKPNSELATLLDLSTHVVEMQEKGIGIFWHKFDYIIIKEGVFKKRETEYTVTYNKVRDLNDFDLQRIKKERELSKEKAMLKKMKKALP